jgi:hypothetical protein
MSVTACRELADVLCGEYEIPLLVLRDFDKSGFSILGTLQRDTQRHEFQHDFPVIDLGLRLEDVDDWGLESEYVAYGLNKSREPRDPRPNLQMNGATENEIAFLRGEYDHTVGYIGRRVGLIDHGHRPWLWLAPPKRGVWMKLAPLGLGLWFTLLEQLPLPLVPILLFADVPSHRGFITANCADPIARGPKVQSWHPAFVE